MSKRKVLCVCLCLCLLCAVLLGGCENNASTAHSLLMSFRELGGTGESTMDAFGKHDYLEVSETTELPETLPIYEDEFPMYQSLPQYPFERLNREEAEEHMKEYLEIFCGNTEQPVPEIETYIEEFNVWQDSRLNEYWCDNINEQIVQMQYKGYEMGVRGSSENNPDFYEATENMDEELMLANPFIKSAISYQKIESPEFKKIWRGEYNENRGCRYIRVSEQTTDFKSKLLYDYFSSVEIIRVPSGFRISINPPLPESPLEEAHVIPYETAKEFIEGEYSCPVVYCEAAYDKDLIYPGRYIPVYRFYLQEEEYVFTRLVPMTDYPIPRGEEMQQYMNEAFGEYATEYYYEEDHTGAYAGVGEK